MLQTLLKAFLQQGRGSPWLVDACVAGFDPRGKVNTNKRDSESVESVDSVYVDVGNVGTDAVHGVSGDVQSGSKEILGLHVFWVFAEFSVHEN